MINDILNISTELLPNTQKTAEERGRDQTLVHFESIVQVSESQFRGSLDPIVVYRKKDAQEQINVQPFNYDNLDKVNLSFEAKIEHFARTTRTLYNNQILEDIESNEATISIDSYDIGDYNDFFMAFNTPTDTGIDLDTFFGSVFLELD